MDSDMSLEKDPEEIERRRIAAEEIKKINEEKDLHNLEVKLLNKEINSMVKSDKKHT